MEPVERGTCSGVRDYRAMAEMLGLRVVLYSLAARLFAAEPDEEMLVWCCTPEVLDALAFLDACVCERTEDESSVSELVRKWPHVCEEASGVSLDELVSSYTKLFVGPHRPPAAPWESVHLSVDGLLFQESTLQVRRAYRAAGFKAAGYPHEPDDHLGTELSFMAVLAASALKKWQNGDRIGVQADLEVQQDFLRDHLCRWIPLFCSAVANAPDKLCVNKFYSAAAEMVSLVVEVDVEVLDELLRDAGPLAVD